MKYSKIGDVIFSATTNEDVTYENEVTDRPVEDLGYISDHVKQKPVRFNISGVVVGSDAYPKLKKLRQYCKGKYTVTYYGRNIMSNVVIQSLSTTHGKDIGNGFEFTLDCKIIKQATGKQVPLQGKDKANPTQKAATSAQTGKVKSLGKKVNASKKTDKEKYTEYKRVEAKNKKRGSK